MEPIEGATEYQLFEYNEETGLVEMLWRVKGTSTEADLGLMTHKLINKINPSRQYN